MNDMSHVLWCPENKGRNCFVEHVSVKITVCWRRELCKGGQSELKTNRDKKKVGSNKVERCSWPQERRKRSGRGRDKDLGTQISDETAEPPPQKAQRQLLQPCRFGWLWR